MSAGRESLGPHELAAELGQRRDAIVALVSLHACGGAATAEHLRRAGARDGSGRMGEAVRWLGAVGLIRRDAKSGTWDVQDLDVIYRLTDLGRSLIDSLTALAEGCAAHGHTAPGRGGLTLRPRMPLSQLDSPG